MKPKLLYSPGSQHSRRVSVLAHELGLDLDLQNVPYGPGGFGGDQREAFLAINPNGKVPVLVHDGIVVWESNAIMWYLAELHGDTPLWPADAKERAQIAMWQVWQAAHLTPAADALFYENLVKPGFLGEGSDPAKVETQLTAFHRWAAVADETLTRSDYLALDRFTCADIAVAAALMYAEGARMPIAEHPPLDAWLERVRARDSWLATEPPPMPPS